MKMFMSDRIPFGRYLFDKHISQATKNHKESVQYNVHRNRLTRRKNFKGVLLLQSHLYHIVL